MLLSRLNIAFLISRGKEMRCLGGKVTEPNPLIILCLLIILGKLCEAIGQSQLQSCRKFSFALLPYDYGRCD
jgi:hypothetical protein